jgi:hypothetical protein
VYHPRGLVKLAMNVVWWFMLLVCTAATIAAVREIINGWTNFEVRRRRGSPATVGEGWVRARMHPFQTVADLRRLTSRQNADSAAERHHLTIPQAYELNLPSCMVNGTCSHCLKLTSNTSRSGLAFCLLMPALSLLLTYQDICCTNVVQSLVETVLSL